MNSMIDKSSFNQRVRQGRIYDYDPVRKLFLNSESGKWVQNPITRRQIIRSAKTIYYHPQVNPILEKISTNTAQLESLQYVLKKIAMKTHLNVKKGLDSKSYNIGNDIPMIWIHHEFFLRLLGPNYMSLMGDLERKGILTEWTVIKPFRRFPTYCFADPSFSTGYSLEPITCQSVDRKIDGYVQWTQQYFTELEIRMAKHIVDNFFAIDMTPEQFDELWKSRYVTKYLPRHPDDAKDFKTYMSKSQSIYKIIEMWNKADRSERLNMFSVDSFGHRFHYVFTYLPSECRRHIKDREAKIVLFTEIDLRNSQPAIYSNMLVKRFGLLSEDHVFIRLSESNYIYDHLAYKLGINKDPDAKVKMLTYMYCYASSSTQKEFEKLYGEPAEIAREYKTLDMDENLQWVSKNERHKILPRMMQREESKMFRDPWRELLKCGIPFLPIHDAVYIAGGDVGTAAFAKQIIRRELAKHLIIKFDLKVK